MSTMEVIAFGVVLTTAAVIGLSLLVGRLSARPRRQRQELHLAGNEGGTGDKEAKRYVFAPVIVVGNRIER